MIVKRAVKRKKDTGPFYRAAMFLYKQAFIRKLPLFASRQVESDLVQLYPGENIHWVKTQYYVKKLSLVLIILFVGALFGAAARFSAVSGILLEEDGSIPRGSYLEGEMELQIQARLGNEVEEFQVLLQPRRLTDQEADALADNLLAQLPELILGENESLESVTEKLKLLEFYEDFPFRVEWESSRPDLLGSSGTVNLPEEPVKVGLLVRLVYEDYAREEVMDVTVAPPLLTPQEQLHRELEKYLMSAEQESRWEDSFQLPEQWQGVQVRWNQIVEDNSTLLWLAAVTVAVLAYLLSDRDLHEQLARRRSCLKQEYPDLVHQLVLFVGAGMTVRGAFQRIASDYERKRSKTEKKLPAYEELLHTCRELQSGVSEGAAYESFGRRTGQQEYIRLSTLLMQNLKRGNSTLLERLREEADKAGEERLQQSRRLGEEAGTKLLAPMVLMLAVVMVMIMIPAFSSM